MVVTLELDVRQRLTDYIDGQISLQQFREWFGPIAWQWASQGPHPGDDIIGLVELKLAEFTSDHLSESDLKEALDKLPYPATLGDPLLGPNPRTWYTSASRPIEVPLKAAAAS